METVFVFFKEENDFLYRRGEEKGIEKGRKEEQLKMLTSLIIESGFSDERIAGISGVPVSFVKEVRDGLGK